MLCARRSCTAWLVYHCEMPVTDIGCSVLVSGSGTVLWLRLGLPVPAFGLGASCADTQLCRYIFGL